MNASPYVSPDWVRQRLGALQIDDSAGALLVQLKREVIFGRCDWVEEQITRRRNGGGYTSDLREFRSHKLPGEFWRKNGKTLFSELDWPTGNASFESQGFADRTRANEFRLVIEGLHFERSAIERVWPTSALTAVPLRGSPGRTTKWDWEGAITELGKLNHEGDLTTVQAHTVSRIQTWFVKQTGDAPADSEIKKRVSAFYQRVRPDLLGRQ